MIRRLPLLALPLLLAACATTPQNTPPETLYHARLDTAQGQALTFEQAVTRVAVVTEASGEHETCAIADLESFTRLEVGMKSVVVVCGSDTLRLGDLLVTPRGYRTEAA
jgi:precorrin-3B methylase